MNKDKLAEAITIEYTKDEFLKQYGGELDDETINDIAVDKYIGTNDDYIIGEFSDFDTDALTEIKDYILENFFDIEFNSNLYNELLFE